MNSIKWRIKPENRITDEQYLSILEATEGNPRDWTLIFVAGNTGLRISEVLHLRVCDLMPESSSIAVIRRKKKVLEKETLQLAPDFFSYVGRYVKESRLKPDDWLFPGLCQPCVRNAPASNGRKVEKLCDGGHLTVRRAQAIWYRLLKKTNLFVKGRGIHTLRHYDLTRFQRVNRDLRATQVRAGHSSPITTTIYADIVDMEEKAAKAGLSVSGNPWKGKN